jgi:hypothetical protein
MSTPIIPCSGIGCIQLGQCAHYYALFARNPDTLQRISFCPQNDKGERVFFLPLVPTPLDFERQYA